MGRIDASATPTLGDLLEDATRISPREEIFPWHNLAARLHKKFGGGDAPATRRALFSKLERLCDQHGTPVYRHVKACASTALDKREPSHWFCRSVVCRLKDCGYPI